MVRTRRELEPWEAFEQDDEAMKKALVLRWARVADGWGLSGLRDGFHENGWTDEDLCWVIDNGWTRGRCEIAALAVAGAVLGLRGRGPAALREAAIETHTPQLYPCDFYPVPPPPDAAQRAKWEKQCLRRRARERRARRGQA